MIAHLKLDDKVLDQQKTRNFRNARLLGHKEQVLTHFTLERCFWSATFLKYLSTDIYGTTLKSVTKYT